MREGQKDALGVNPPAPGLKVKCQFMIVKFNCWKGIRYDSRTFFNGRNTHHFADRMFRLHESR